MEFPMLQHEVVFILKEIIIFFLRSSLLFWMRKKKKKKRPSHPLAKEFFWETNVNIRYYSQPKKVATRSELRFFWLYKLKLDCLHVNIIYIFMRESIHIILRSKFLGFFFFFFDRNNVNKTSKKTKKCEQIKFEYPVNNQWTVLQDWIQLLGNI